MVSSVDSSITRECTLRVLLLLSLCRNYESAAITIAIQVGCLRCCVVRGNSAAVCVRFLGTGTDKSAAISWKAQVAADHVISFLEKEMCAMEWREEWWLVWGSCECAKQQVTLQAVACRCPHARMLRRGIPVCQCVK